MTRTSKLDTMGHDELLYELRENNTFREHALSMAGLDRKDLSPGERRLLRFMQYDYDHFVKYLLKNPDNLFVLIWVFKHPPDLWNTVERDEIEAAKAVV